MEIVAKKNSFTFKLITKANIESILADDFEYFLEIRKMSIQKS